MKFRTWTAKKEELKAEWYLVDATGQPLGRLASNVARILRGKHKPTYTPNLNCGDHVIVINAARVVLTGGKVDKKIYTRYSGYPGGLRTRTFRQQQALDPTWPVRNAVRGMLPGNSLGADQLRRLRVYAGPEHEHQAQRPKAITFTEKGDIQLV